MRNTSAFGDIPISPLNGMLDLRSTPGTMPISDFRIILNASLNELGKRCRRPQWKKYGSDSPRGFNNQDLSDRLNNTQYFCDDYDSGCACPAVPSCLSVVDYEYGVVLNNCVDGADSDAAEWDGTLNSTGTCSWGFTYGTYAFGGKDAAVVVNVKSCTDGIYVYHIEISVRLPNNTGLIVWAGDSIASPIGIYTRTDGCDETATIQLANCEACEQPIVTADPPSGSVITEGSYVSLFATGGATIFFTVDGTTPDNTSEMYTGPFPINADTTVKAIAYTGTCVSDVGIFTYETIPTTEFLFEYTCDTEDQAGVFDEFEANGSSDYNWRLTLNLPEIDVERVEIYETNSSGVWVTGQSWATMRTIYPVELGGADFTTYPAVIFEDGVKLANDYTPVDAMLVSGLAEEEHIWMIYGQPFVPLVGYFKIIFIYWELGVQKKIYSVIPHDCEYYYY